MTYKLTRNMTTGGLYIRRDDGTTFGLDSPVYLAWLAAGNAPEPEDAPSLTEIKADAAAQVCAEIDRQISASGHIPQSGYAAEMVSDIAFIVQTWEAAGEPEAMPETIAARVEAEAAIYQITPVQMVTVWRQKWLAMRTGLAPILAQRRAWLLEIEAATTAAEVEAVLGQF